MQRCDKASTRGKLEYGKFPLEKETYLMGCYGYDYGPFPRSISRDYSLALNQIHKMYFLSQNFSLPPEICTCQSGTKCGLGSHCTGSHFFRLIARILTIFDKKYRIWTFCDKRESYLIVLQQNNV